MLSIEKLLSDVEQFQKSVLRLETPEKPTLLARYRHEFAMKFLHEELQEFDQAYTRQDLPEVVDALVDLIYVALGRLIEMGVPPGPVFKEVHDANMKKYKGKTKRGQDTDAAKPDDWVPPDHSWLLRITEVHVKKLKDLYAHDSDPGVYRPRPNDLEAAPIEIPTNRKVSGIIKGRTVSNGETQQQSAAKKNPLAKPQTALIPYEALAVEAQAFGYGAYVKYSPWDWLGGRPYTEVLSSIDHHLKAWAEREKFDPESGYHHLGHARCDIAFLITWEAMGLKQFDDRRPIHTVTYHKPEELRMGGIIK